MVQVSDQWPVVGGMMSDVMLLMALMLCMDAVHLPQHEE
jgi:hypothetical protein